MNFHDEMEKMQKQEITIHGQINAGTLPAFQEMIRLAIEEMQRRKQLEAALKKSSVAYLDGYNPYLN